MSTNHGLSSTMRIAGRSLPIPSGLYVNNRFVKGSGAPLTTIDPSNGQPLLPSSSTISTASSSDVDAAVQAARQAFTRAWGLKSNGTQRSNLLHKLAQLVEQNQEDLALVESCDSGKPIRWARGDVQDSAACLRYYAGHADKIVGQSLELNYRTKHCFTKHEPVGVVAQIVPWNYPILMWAWKVAPALAAGCTIVFKPAENTPLSTLLLADLFRQAGYPEGVFNVVNGHGEETGAALVSHPDIDKIAFTGSTATGRSIALIAAQYNRKVTLELGGKSPNIIFPSADLEQASKWAALGGFENSGQACSAGSRVLVHRNIKEEVEERLIRCAKQIKIGHPLDPETWQGPQVSQAQFDSVMSYIQIGKNDGSKLLYGGERHGSEGYYIQPTIFTDVSPKSVIARDEIFGPVIAVIPFDTEEEAIHLANDTPYGLAAGVHSKDADQIARVSTQLQAGTVWINQYSYTSNNAPFGGFKASGIGRELGSYGLDAYLQVKAVHWNYGERIDFP
ncbi:BZ3500_MvSof-1268-A1-R1_Chr11-1g03272 [Microbotryum saponariae]|uniref:BZ3500_MvSof-1268-A1-R1_Chr11-1g03272 protein n=1 Tax=Microbotryum saponariae TaxID=289078 RepID=A0A2X0LFZ1_9BASI|nr:BZ3501_MvSof-1269-A2-R1_Chr11g02847 [Microbotryum saponariae]SDA03858.1 BZ3500_MvSof-1268-A1-R1_Chr11-1g03272 [Microbotryum saponariae]